MNLVSDKIDRIFKACFVLILLCCSATALALDDFIITEDTLTEIRLFSTFEQSSRSTLLPLRYAQSNSRNSNGSNSFLRSKSEVMDEVKRRYGGQVLRISLNQQSASYNVRVLLPNGKVRNLQISARR